MMNQREIFRKAGDILKELQDQYTFLAQDPDNLNELELELFMANSSFLSDHIHILNKLNDKKNAGRVLKQVAEPAPEELETLSANDHPEREAEATDTGDTHHEMPEEEIKTYFLLNEEEQIRLDEEHKDVPQIVAEEGTEVEPSEEEGIEEPDELEETETQPEKEETKEENENELQDEELEEEPADDANQDDEPEEETVESEEGKEEPEPEKEEAVEKISGPVKEEPETEQEGEPKESVQEVTQTERTIAVPVEQVQVNPEPVAEKRTLNELFSAQRAAGQGPENRPAAQYTDLKSMISLNDKLLFVKDLFNGYSLAYSEAIDITNKQSGFEAADKFLQSNYAQKNNWADKQQTVDKLYEILNRRFPG